MKKIKVRSSNISACNLANHFQKNWVDVIDRLHSKAQEYEVDIRTNQSYDEIMVTDKQGKIVLRYTDNECLRLDKIQQDIIDL